VIKNEILSLDACGLAGWLGNGFLAVINDFFPSFRLNNIYWIWYLSENAKIRCRRENKQTAHVETSGGFGFFGFCFCFCFLIC